MIGRLKIQNYFDSCNLSTVVLPTSQTFPRSVSLPRFALPPPLLLSWLRQQIIGRLSCPDFKRKTMSSQQKRSMLSRRSSGHPWSRKSHERHFRESEWDVFISCQIRGLCGCYGFFATINSMGSTSRSFRESRLA